MKQLQQNTEKSKKLFFILLVIFGLTTSIRTFAKVDRWVDDIKGNVFVQREGKLELLGSKSKIFDLAHISTEENASVVFGDSFDHKYQMPGKSLIQILNKIIELKRGNLRIISTNDKEFFQIQTANSIIQFKKADAIISYDVVEGTTQVMVLYGSARLSNILTPDNYINVESGTFSFVDNKENEGYPRRATPVGKESFRKMMAIFNEQIPSTSPPKPIVRTIAGINDNYVPNEIEKKGEGQIFYIATDEKSKKNQKFSLDDFYRAELSEMKKVKEENKVPLFKRRTGVKIFIIDGNMRDNPPKNGPKALPAHQKMDHEKKMPKRGPASIKKQSKMTHNGKMTKFEKTLNDQYVAQRRHNNEVTNLIGELKSYSNDYDKNH